MISLKVNFSFHNMSPRQLPEELIHNTDDETSTDDDISGFTDDDISEFTDDDIGGFSEEEDDMEHHLHLNSSNQGNAEPQHQALPPNIDEAINFINVIRNRFQARPHIYYTFVEILRVYQEGQRANQNEVPLAAEPMTQCDVYALVAVLFQDQEDLLQQFTHFLNGL